MYGTSISTPCAHLRQDLDGKSERWPRTSSCAEKSSNFFDDTGRSLHASEKDDTKLPRPNAFSLYALGKRIVSGMSFQKAHVVNSNECRSMLFKSTGASPSRHGFWLGRDSSVRIIEHFDSVNSKYISAATSFKGTGLRGLSYVASFNHDNERSSYKGLSLEQAARVASSSTISRKLCSPPRSIGCDSPCDVFASFSDRSEDSGSPLFDPDLLNVFEQALEQLPAPLDKTTCTNDRAVKKSSTAENLFRQKTECKRAGEKKETTVAKKIFEGLLGNPRVKKDISKLKKLVFSIISEYHENSTTFELLERFPPLCPPAGEGKVVLFFTSLRGIRTTYENCNSIRIALFGYRVKLDERDVSMHSDFKRELKDLLGKSVSLPRLFIKGRYIGGVEEVMLLIEDGVLGKLLEDVPRTSVGACEGCADIRFVPCSECSGSCKIISFENKVVRCPRCNENGLVRCTICC